MSNAGEGKATFICIVCQEPRYCNPVQLCDHNHVSCLECAQTWRGVGKRSCPVCRGPLSGDFKQVHVDMCVDPEKFYSEMSLYSREVLGEIKGVLETASQVEERKLDELERSTRHSLKELTFREQTAKTKIKNLEEITSKASRKKQQMKKAYHIWSHRTEELFRLNSSTWNGDDYLAIIRKADLSMLRREMQKINTSISKGKKYLEILRGKIKKETETIGQIPSKHEEYHNICVEIYYLRKEHEKEKEKRLELINSLDEEIFSKRCQIEDFERLISLRSEISKEEKKLERIKKHNASQTSKKSRLSKKCKELEERKSNLESKIDWCEHM